MSITRLLRSLMRKSKFSAVKVLGLFFLLITFSFLLKISTLPVIPAVSRSDHSTAKHERSKHRRDDLPEDKTPNTVINPHPFRFTINPESVCRSTKDLELLVYVHSKPTNIENRIIIRRTWGNVTRYSQTVRVVFVLGLPAEGLDIQADIDAESSKYGDLVQEDFVDSYKNLTYKAIAGLKWATTYCAHAQYLLKTDDDIVINMFTLFLVLPKRDTASIVTPGLLMCRTWSTMNVDRNGKWGVSVDDFAGMVYPTYCSGMGYIMTVDVARALYVTSYHVPFFWVDDVFITGLVAAKISLKHTDISKYYYIHLMKLDRQTYVDHAIHLESIFSHVFGFHGYEIWNAILYGQAYRRRLEAITTLYPPVMNTKHPANASEVAKLGAT